MGKKEHYLRGLLIICRYSTTASASVFQTEDAGSIPVIDSNTIDIRRGTQVGEGDGLLNR